MLLKELSIERPHSYGNDPPKPLQGKVVLESTSGRVEVNLSPQAIGRLLGQIAEEVGATAKAQAKQVQSGVTAASNEVALIGEIPEASL